MGFPRKRNPPASQFNAYVGAWAMAFAVVLVTLLLLSHGVVPATQGIDDLRDGAASTIDAGCPFWNYPLDLMPIFDFEILRLFVLVE
jgi:hypothetical protein